MAKFYQNAGEPNSKMNWISERDNPDTTNDSWDSGAFQKDLPDHYQNYEKNDPSDDDHLEDEGDENDLGDMSDEEFRLRNALPTPIPTHIFSIPSMTANGTTPVSTVIKI